MITTSWFQLGGYEAVSEGAVDNAAPTDGLEKNGCQFLAFEIILISYLITYKFSKAFYLHGTVTPLPFQSHLAVVRIETALVLNAKARDTIKTNQTITSAITYTIDIIYWLIYLLCDGKFVVIMENRALLKATLL